MRLSGLRQNGQLRHTDGSLTLCLSLTCISKPKGSPLGTYTWNTTNWWTTFRLWATPDRFYGPLVAPLLWKSAAACCAGFGGSWIRWPCRWNMWLLSSGSVSFRTSGAPADTLNDLCGFGPIRAKRLKVSQYVWYWIIFWWVALTLSS